MYFHKLLLYSSLLVVVYGNGTGGLHPCRRQQPVVRKGGSFEIGFVFWTEASYEDWGSTEDGPHPCSQSDRASWASDGVIVSYFSVEVDKLTLLDSVNTLEDDYLADKRNVTVIAFSGGYRSEPRTVRVKEGNNWNVVRSLAVIADFDENGLKQLQWFDLKCGDCLAKDKCLSFRDQQSCARICDNSSTHADCRTEIYISFDGVDKRDQVLNSATQIRRLRRASVSHVYQSSRSFASSAIS